MFDNIRGIITFEAVAPEPEAFVNMLRESPVSVSDIRLESGKIYGDVYRADFDEVKRTAERLGAQLCVHSKRGGVFTVRKYRRRTGMLIGLVLAFAMVAYLSNVVMIVRERNAFRQAGDLAAQGSGDTHRRIYTVGGSEGGGETDSILVGRYRVGRPAV